jgi:glycosyltransferase involved in cell wall biosynthesis
VLRVCLVGLLAGGHSGVPRYAAALTRALDRVASEFPGLSLCLLTTVRGARATATEQVAVELIGTPFATANAGLRRIVAEQIQARRGTWDLLHFFDLNGPFLARRPFVTTIHDAAIRHGLGGTRMAHKRLLQPWAIGHAAAAVAVSGFAKEEAVRLFGADPARIEVIHSGPGLEASADGQQATNGTPYLLYVGNLTAHKNLPFLVRAFSAAGVDGRLLLVGRRGEGFGDVRKAIEASPARERIELRHDVADGDLDRLYRNASTCVLPSHYEGFGFTALEAMARGCPVLASDIPAVREVSGDGAWLLPPDDESAWAGAIRRVSRDRELRDKLRQQGRTIAQRYSWEHTARRVCGLFLRVGGAI